MVTSMKPLPEWGPANIEDKKRYFAALALRPITPDPRTKTKKFFDNGDDIPSKRTADEANATWSKSLESDKCSISLVENNAQAEKNKPKGKHKMLRIHIDDSNFDETNVV